VRSATMRAVHSENTRPELVVRSTLHQLGYRFRLHRSDLPGKPDIVFPGRRKVIFVHGCFWHGHDCARGARIPKTNREYWVSKITRNKQRDLLHLSNLEACGWRALAVWECQCADSDALSHLLSRFLESKERNNRFLCAPAR
jgi:DNA mismatch endonuclease, patch repair protein